MTSYGTPAATDFEVLPLSDAALDDVLAALQTAFNNTSMSRDWFTWKHLENPAGPSLGWVAQDERGIVGVRLFLRWNLTAGDRQIKAVRPVDAATVPRARGRGVFKQLTHYALRAVSQDGDVDLVCTMPNENSRPGYIKMRWDVLPPIEHRLRPIVPRTVSAAVSASKGTIFATLESVFDHEPRLTSARTISTLEWRYGTRGGLSYEFASLREAVGPSAIVYRVAEKRNIRLLVVCELVGDRASRRELVHSVARRTRTHGVLAAQGPGAYDHQRRWPLRRGHSRVAVRAIRPVEPDPRLRVSWAFTLGDLEQVL